MYDGSAVPASLGYQFALGGINTFRELRGELATSVGVVTQLSVNQSLNLPLGASIASRYQRINTRNWTSTLDTAQEVVDGTQIVFPDVSLRWTGQPAGLRSIISNLGANVRVLETRQVNGTQPLFGITVDDRGELRVRSYPMTGSVVFAGARPVSSTVGYSLSRRLDAKPGLSSNGAPISASTSQSRGACPLTGTRGAICARASAIRKARDRTSWSIRSHSPERAGSPTTGAEPSA